MARFDFSPAVLAALGAAALFGGSVPFAKQLASHTPPTLLAGLLYLGSGIGVCLIRAVRDVGWRPVHMAAVEWRWFAAATFFGGMLAPILLMVGLTYSPAANASLLLNLEAVLTALLAWIAFKENADARIVWGMLLIIAGGVVLSWSGTPVVGQWRGPLAIAGACLCWAIDNNLTRKVSGSDAFFIAGVKGLVAGVINTGVALGLGTRLPGGGALGFAMLVGFLGYGLSLALFVLALRGLGTARTGAYFSTAPFIGAAIAMVVFHEPTSLSFWLAAMLMGSGVWLHLTEHHEHEHTHEPLLHSHRHVHDAHHDHTHDFPWDGREPHAHVHKHAVITHSHPHYPDIHHRHTH